MNYVGIDHHRQYSHLTVMDQTGQVLQSGRVANLRSEIERFLEGLEAMEAVIETGRSTESRQAQRIMRLRAYYMSAMTALKNRVYAFLAQQREEVRETNAWSGHSSHREKRKIL